MRSSCACSMTLVAVLMIDCGGSGSPTPASHPKLDQDYAGNFAGTWEGTATISTTGQPPQTGPVRQRIDHAGFNRLAIAQLCPGIDGAAGVDSATGFSIDPLTCSPIPEACGPVTIRYDSGTGKLAQGTLTVNLTGSGTGCGQTLAFTFTFVGNLPAPVDHGPPSAVLASANLGATIGVPVTLDASASSDPDAHPLTFAWSVTSRPSGAEPTLAGAGTAKPVFTASVEGTYLVKVVVTSSDGQTADAIVQISVHQAIAAGQSFIELQSDAGDYIGAGRSYEYTKANAQIALSESAGHLSLSITGDEWWSADFQVPSSLARFQPGTYDGLQRYPFNDPVHGGLEWSGEGRGCNALTGSFTVASATYTAGALTAIDLAFEQHCEGVAAALHGHIVWETNDPTQPPGPTAPPPGLWKAPSGATPATGNYVYLQSEFGDYIGAGGTYTYTQADSLLSVSSTANHLSLRVNGDEMWFGDFQGMSTLTRLEAGYYGNLERYPFHNPVRGGLDWSGEGRGCNTLTGWFVVDAVTYTGDTLSAIDLRFEQHCEGGSAALHGQIHWDASDTTQPPGPIDPPPADLWKPAAGSTPVSGNYVYLQSDAGDYIGQGATYTYAPPTDAITLSSSGNRISMNVGGWFGDFQGMSTIARMEPGYYGGLRRFPFHNPVRGGLSFWGQGRGCNELTGWFAVDAVSYANGALTAVDLRFEQHCEGGTPALRGQIRWSAGP